MSEDSESRLSRWSRRKSGQEPETEEKPQGSNKEDNKKQHGSVTPVAERRFVPLLPPLAEPEEGEIEMEAAPPGALALKTQLEAEKAAREEEEAEEEEEDIVCSTSSAATADFLEGLEGESEGEILSFRPFTSSSSVSVSISVSLSSDDGTMS